MVSVTVMTGFKKATKYPISVHRIVHKTAKALGIGSELSSKEINEKVSQLNAEIRELFEKNGIKKYYVVSIVLRIEGDAKSFNVNVEKIYVMKPFGVFNEAGEFREINDEEFEKDYEEMVNTVLGQEVLQQIKQSKKKKKRKGNGESAEEKSEVKVVSLMEWMNLED